MEKNLRKHNGITLIALVITIIVLLILAGVSMATLTRDNGILEQTFKAKEQSRISEEEEQLELAVIQVMANNKYGELTAEELNHALGKCLGEGKATVTEDGDQLLVSISGREDKVYPVDKEGNVTKPPIDKIVDEYAGDLSKGDKDKGSTENNPYEINCIEDLVAFSIMAGGGNAELGLASNNFNEKYVILKRTLDFKSMLSYNDYTTKKYGDLNADGTIENLKTELTKTSENCIGFTPIKDFRGTFDGKSNGIYNLYQNRAQNAGLFDTNGGTIFDLKISGLIKGNCDYAGGIVCINNGGTIKKCNNYVNISSDGAGQYGGVSGIVGANMLGGEINSCINYGNIYSQTNSGGIVGYFQSSSKIINCANMGNISTSNETANRWPGGIVGMSRGNTEIYNCYNIGKVELLKRPTVNAHLSGFGSIVGFNWEGICKIKNVYSLLDVKTVGNKYVGSSECYSDFYINKEEKYTKNYMMSADFANELNKYIQGVGEDAKGFWKWKIGEEGYPTFDYDNLWDGTNWSSEK